MEAIIIVVSLSPNPDRSRAYSVLLDCGQDHSFLRLREMMAQEFNYWTKRLQQQLNRRQWLAGIVTSAGGIAAAATLGCGDSGSRSPSSTPSASRPQQPSDVAWAMDIRAGRPGKRGGTLRRLNTFVSPSVDPLK